MPSLAVTMSLYPRTLPLHMGGRVDPRTEAVRYNDPQTARWLGNTQTWRWLGGSDEHGSWPGGDALVVTCGHLGAVRSLAVIRVGDRAPFVEDITSRGIAGFFAAFGITTSVAP